MFVYEHVQDYSVFKDFSEMIAQVLTRHKCEMGALYALQLSKVNVSSLNHSERSSVKLMLFFFF